MKQKLLVVGALQENTYILYDENTKKTIVIDPGDGDEKILWYLEKQELIPEAVLLTHGHFDHIMAANILRERYHIPVLLGEHDADTAKDPKVNFAYENGAGEVSVEADRLLEDDEEMEIAGFKIRVIETPGHTPGGVCYYLPDENRLYSGDTLFYRSVGRTSDDHQHKKLVKNIEEKLFVLPDDTLVYPGHGFPTKIGIEKEENPFCGENAFL